MSIVMFATLCDHCGARSDEYSAWPSCRECLEDTCEQCYMPGSYTADERHECLCNRCAAEEHLSDVDDVAENRMGYR
jgi:hypothetical protein